MVWDLCGKGPRFRKSRRAVPKLCPQEKVREHGNLGDGSGRTHKAKSNHDAAPAQRPNAVTDACATHAVKSVIDARGFV